MLKEFKLRLLKIKAKLFCFRYQIELILAKYDRKTGLFIESKFYEEKIMRIQDSFVIHPEGRRFEIQPKVRPAKTKVKVGKIYNCAIEGFSELVKSGMSENL